MATLDEKQHAHELIERLPGDRITTVVRFLELMLRDPITCSLAVTPVDDELFSDEERQALARSEAWFRERGGKGIPMEEVLADFGLTMDGFPLDKGRGGALGSIGPAKLDKLVAMQVVEGVLRFARTRPGDVKQLRADLAGRFRLRLGDYRVCFTEEDDLLCIHWVSPPR